jgi:hypothetical protein
MSPDLLLSFIPVTGSGVTARGVASALRISGQPAATHQKVDETLRPLERAGAVQRLGLYYWRLQ